MTAGAALRRLQVADSRIAALRTELAAAEEAVRRDAELERQRSLAGTAATATREASERAATAEAEMKTLETRARALDRRLYGGSVRNPHELLEMQQELEALRARLSEAESAALELLETAEVAGRQDADAARELASHQARRAGELAPLRERVARLQAELEAAVAERASIAHGIDAADLALYQRVAGRHQPAVVALAGDSCGGCHLPLSIEERRLVRTSEGIVQCPNCDRILVP
jgi:uncharacterized protein